MSQPFSRELLSSPRYIVTPVGSYDGRSRGRGAHRTRWGDLTRQHQHRPASGDHRARKLVGPPGSHQPRRAERPSYRAVQTISPNIEQITHHHGRPPETVDRFEGVDRGRPRAGTRPPAGINRRSRQAERPAADPARSPAGRRGRQRERATYLARHRLTRRTRWAEDSPVSPPTPHTGWSDGPAPVALAPATRPGRSNGAYRSCRRLPESATLTRRPPGTPSFWMTDR